MQIAGFKNSVAVSSSIFQTVKKTMSSAEESNTFIYRLRIVLELNYRLWLVFMKSFLAIDLIKQCTLFNYSCTIFINWISSQTIVLCIFDERLLQMFCVAHSLSLPIFYQRFLNQHCSYALLMRIMSLPRMKKSIIKNSLLPCLILLFCGCMLSVFSLFLFGFTHHNVQKNFQSALYRAHSSSIRCLHIVYIQSVHSPACDMNNLCHGFVCFLQGYQFVVLSQFIACLLPIHSTTLLRSRILVFIWIYLKIYFIKHNMFRS